MSRAIQTLRFFAGLSDPTVAAICEATNYGEIVAKFEAAKGELSRKDALIKSLRAELEQLKREVA